MTDLPTTQFGRTGFGVTRIGYGAMQLRDPHGGVLDRSAMKKLLHAVLDSGINFIDTSPDYGQSENLIGEALRARRDEYFLATKCGCPIDPSTMDRRLHDYSRPNVRRCVEESLRRLRTSYVDLVQIHTSPSREELEQNDTLAELELLRSEGKVRFIGMSGTLPNLDGHVAMSSFDAFQIPYSIFETAHARAIIRAGEAGAGIIIRGSVWRGIPHTNINPLVRLRRLVGRLLRRGADLWLSANFEELLGGMSVTEFLLRFTLTHPYQSTTIVGTTHADHLAANVSAASKGPLAPELYAEVIRRLELEGAPS